VTSRAVGRPTRVLYFINGFARGGAELGLVDLVRGGVFEGCELTVAALVGGDRGIIDALSGLGAAPILFSDAVRMGPMEVATGVVRLAALVHARRPDVMILSLPQANILGRVVGKMLGVPVIASFEHNTVLARPVYTQLFRMTSGLVDVAIGDAPATLAEVASSHYIRPPRETIIAPLVSVPAPPPPQPSPHAPRVVAVGRLTPVKNHLAAICGIRALRAAGRDVTLEIYGEGALRTKLEEAVGDDPAIALKGFASHWWTRGPFSAFLLTSLHEGLCIAAIEAMWAGIPVIAPMIGGLKDYASDATMTVLDDVSDAAVAKALGAVLDDPHVARVKAERAQARVIEQFGVEAVAAQRRALRQAIVGRFASGAALPGS